MTDLSSRLRKRAEIRRQIPDRKSVQEGERDRLADLLEEAADELEVLGWQRMIMLAVLDDMTGLPQDRARMAAARIVMRFMSTPEPSREG